VIQVTHKRQKLGQNPDEIGSPGYGEEPVRQTNIFSGFSHWVLNELIQDVPEESALCEFDCRRAQCTQGEWSSCSRRLNSAAGELMPNQEVDPIVNSLIVSAGK
jgi:hypothetical protein